MAAALVSINEVLVRDVLGVIFDQLYAEPCAQQLFACVCRDWNVLAMERWRAALRDPAAFWTHTLPIPLPSAWRPAKPFPREAAASHPHCRALPPRLSHDRWCAYAVCSWPLLEWLRPRLAINVGCVRALLHAALFRGHRRMAESLSLRALSGNTRSEQLKVYHYYGYGRNPGWELRVADFFQDDVAKEGRMDRFWDNETLLFAVRGDRVSTIQWLFSFHDFLELDPYWILKEACAHGSIRALRFFLTQKETHPPWKLYMDHVEEAACHGQLTTLKWIVRHVLCNDAALRTSFYKDTLPMSAARTAQHATLKFLIAAGCELTTQVAREAALSGDIATLELLRSHGCPMNQETCEGAVQSLQLDTLIWVHEHGCELTPVLFKSAVQSPQCNELYESEENYQKQIAILDWLHAQGCLRRRVQDERLFLAVRQNPNPHLQSWLCLHDLWYKTRPIN